MLGYAADPFSGGPLAENFLRREGESRDYLALTFDKREMLSHGSPTERLVSLPPLRGIARVLSNGELFHPRLRPPVLDPGGHLVGIDLPTPYLRKPLELALTLDLVRAGDRAWQATQLTQFLAAHGEVLAYQALPPPTEEEQAFFAA